MNFKVTHPVASTMSTAFLHMVRLALSVVLRLVFVAKWVNWKCMASVSALRGFVCFSVCPKSRKLWKSDWLQLSVGVLSSCDGDESSTWRGSKVSKSDLKLAWIAVNFFTLFTSLSKSTLSVLSAGGGIVTLDNPDGRQCLLVLVFFRANLSRISSDSSNRGCIKPLFFRLCITTVQVTSATHSSKLIFDRPQISLFSCDSWCLKFLKLNNVAPSTLITFKVEVMFDRFSN